MQIEIDIPRPWLTLSLIVGGVAAYFYLGAGSVGESVTAQVTQGEIERAEEIEEREGIEEIKEREEEVVVPPPVGGQYRDPALITKAAEEEVRRARIEQAILERQEEILRYELRVLEEERQARGPNVSPELEEEFRHATRRLVSLLQDQERAEQFLLESLNQIWEAQGRATALGKGFVGSGKPLKLSWPVKVTWISAGFHGSQYEEIFGFAHEGVDLPVLQGTLVRTAAAGTVREVAEGPFDYILIQHDDGSVALYGHLSAFLVEEGQYVRAGDPIARSGGRPGTDLFTTGEHLHFELRINGVAVDPLKYLPPL